MANIAVIGAGGWGTALAVMAHQYGNTVSLWSPFEEEVAAIRRHDEHKKLLPGVPVPPKIVLTDALEPAASADLVILAVPSFAVRQTSRLLAPHLREGAVVACVAKGLEQGSYADFSTVIGEEIPNCPNVILSGPSHAEEVSRGEATSIVAASHDMEAAQKVQDWLMSPAFRVYVNDDVIGVELGGALKNIIAVAAGTADGLGLGDNAKAALMTRGLTEIARLGVACGARTETFGGLSGMGDLIVTCTSMHSRNRRCGILVGQGLSGAEAVKQVGMTVEGYTNTKNAYEMGRRLGVEMPITNEVYKVLYEGKDIRQAIADLMGRPRRHESEYTWLQEGNLSR